MTLAFTPLLATLGPSALLLLVAIVFAETGLLVGFFLPGDSLLFTAGLFAASGVISTPVAVLIGATWLAAVIGDQVAYRIGTRIGPIVLVKPRSRLLSPRHHRAARDLFDRYGPKAIILARFVAVARTL